MCLLAIIEPGQNIPDDDLRSACIVNAHGFGVAVAKAGKIINIVVCKDGVDNDWEAVKEILEEHSEYRRMLHLRYRTQGVIDPKNAMPFWVTKKPELGVDIVMGHNGTMGSWSDKEDPTLSDTHVFNRDYVTPLIEREIAARKTFKLKDKTPVIHDNWVTQHLCQQVTSTSKVALMDGDGAVFIVNERANDAGPQEWGWASNTYSFNRYHRVPATSHQRSGTGTQEPYWRRTQRLAAERRGNDPFFQQLNDLPPGRNATSAGSTGNDTNVIQSVYSLPPMPWMTNGFKVQADSVRSNMMTIKTLAHNTPEHIEAVKSKRPLFTEVAGCELIDVLKLTPDQLKTIKRDSSDCYDLLMLELIEFVRSTKLASGDLLPKKDAGLVAGSAL